MVGARLPSRDLQRDDPPLVRCQMGTYNVSSWYDSDALSIAAEGARRNYDETCFVPVNTSSRRARFKNFTEKHLRQPGDGTQ